MAISFVKAQALGNDFVIFEDFPLNSDQIRHIAHRRYGIGCDQVVFFQRSDNQPLVTVQFYNADGTEAEACGNGSRALVTLIGQRARQPLLITLRTKTRQLECEYDQGLATINMGSAQISDSDVPLLATQVGLWGAVNVGNPHLIAFVKSLDLMDIELIGARLEHHPDFPNRVNVSVAEVQTNKIILKTWERGAGYTGACGTAACATAALAHARGLVTDQVSVLQLGGELTITPTPQNIKMSGSATLVFKGEIEL